MTAIREVQEVKSGTVTIDLPTDWDAEEVEIIIRPLKKRSNNGKSLSELLLEAPTLTDEELREYESVREWMNQWHVEEF